jgi:hypothetical protein
MCSTERGKT